MPFTPLRFQSALAVGGVALMPFVLMQFTFAHAGKLVTVRDLAGGYDAASLFLVPVMLVSTLLHFFLIAQMSIEFVRWARKPGAFRAFLSDPASSTGIFSPMVALGMTVNVVLGPVAFFLPEFSEQVPTWVAVGIYPYALLFLALVAVSLVVAKTWFFRGGQAVAFNFNWLLDVFAWGMVALAGAGITMAATDAQIARWASILTLCAISVGLFIYGVKGLYLLVSQLLQGATPAEPLKPAHFVVVPINCLFAISIYKIAGYTDKVLGVNLAPITFVAIVILFATAAFWILFCLVAFRDWFVHQFTKPDFYPSQWGLVCVLVGLEVLAVYNHGNYFASTLLLGFSYLSIAVAAVVYTFVYLKFTGLIKPVKPVQA